MNEFLEFFDEKTHTYPMHLQIYYSKTMDWCIRVWKKGCATDGGDLELIQTQSCDMHFAFAKAHVELKEWLLKNERGY